MPRAEEFDAFYAQTRSRLLHQTYALTGDLGAAAAALRDAFAHAWQYWHRLRVRDAEGWVRHEAGQLGTLRHYAHLRRRLDETGADTDLIERLQSLPATSRRLVLLQTLGELTLAAAAREVAMTDEAALDATDAALERLLGHTQSLAELERRLDGLRTVSERVALPRADVLRRQGRRRQRRATVAVVVASAAVVVGAGVLVTPVAPDGEVATDERRRGGEPTPTEPTPEPPGADEDQLLQPSVLTGLDPRTLWRETRRPETAADRPCQTQPSADPRARDAYARTFRADSGPAQRLTQTVEVSRGESAAERARARTLRWYAGCVTPRMQLVSAHEAERTGPDVEMLRFRSYGGDVRTMTVAVARTGVVTTTLLHEVARPVGPPVQALGQRVSVAIELLCTTSDGPCDRGGRVEPTPLPPTGEGRGFLGVVDLPPVGELRTPWAGTGVNSARPNPAATLCDQTEFTMPAFVRARSRTFVMPESDLPLRFGLSETVGVLRDETRARQFVGTVVSDIDGCERRELSVSVDSSTPVDAGPVQGQVWQLTFEVTDGSTVTYRVGIVRNRDAVAQLAFSGTQTADVGGAFAALVVRAGQRLAELEDVPPGPGGGSGAPGGGGSGGGSGAPGGGGPGGGSGATGGDGQA